MTDRIEAKGLHGVAVVFGASGGIGGALVAALNAGGRWERVIGFSRSTAPSVDLLDEASLEHAAAFAASQGELRLVLDATGFLSDAASGRSGVGASSTPRIWRGLSRSTRSGRR